MKTRYKSIFFDLDDTLWDTYHNNKECLEEIFTDYSFDRYYDSFDTFFQLYMPYNLTLWKKYRNHEIDRQTLILERFLYVLRPMGNIDNEYVFQLNHDYLRRTTQKTKLISGAIELLEYLSPFYRLFILSNGFREIQVLKLKNAALSSYFEKIILSEDAKIQKPHKEIFDFALKNTNSRRRESLMIGDCFEADIEGAYHAKIDQLWFNPGNLPCKKIIPTYQVRTLGEIQCFL